MEFKIEKSDNGLWYVTYPDGFVVRVGHTEVDKWKKLIADYKRAKNVPEAVDAGEDVMETKTTEKEADCGC